jgi:hypothetical protein
MSSLTWVKSSYSGGQGGNCVEVARTTDGMAVRDSKNTNGAVLALSASAWLRLVADVRNGGLTPR